MNFDDWKCSNPEDDYDWLYSKEEENSEDETMTPTKDLMTSKDHLSQAIASIKKAQACAVLSSKRRAKLDNLIQMACDEYGDYADELEYR